MNQTNKTLNVTDVMSADIMETNAAAAAAAAAVAATAAGEATTLAAENAANELVIAQNHSAFAEFLITKLAKTAESDAFRVAAIKDVVTKNNKLKANRLQLKRSNVVAIATAAENAAFTAIKDVVAKNNKLKANRLQLRRSHVVAIATAVSITVVIVTSWKILVPMVLTGYI